MSMEATLAALDQLQEALRDLISALQNGDGIPQREPEPEPAKAPEPEAPKATFEEVRTLLVAKSREGKTAKVKTLLEHFKASSLSDVDPADYADLLTAAEEL